MGTQSKNGPLTPQQWREVRRILDKILQLSRKDVERFLADVSARKPWLRTEVESLFKAKTRSGRIFDDPLVKTEGNEAAADELVPVPFTPEKAGKYLMAFKLGEGGMAEVFLALSQGPGTFEKLVALKKVHNHLCKDPSIRALFEYEASLGGRLNHANIAEVYDFSSVDDVYLLAMEFVDGLDLCRITQRLREDSVSLPPECAVYLAYEICKGLDYAHTRKDEETGAPLNLVHRDISPKNVIVSFDGDVKLVDFGLAKGKDRVTRSTTGALRGTVLYISPEVASGSPADQRSDLFAVAVILYELLAGKHLFESENLLSLIAEIRDSELSVAELQSIGLNPRLIYVLTNGLKRNPDERYQTVAVLLRDLQPILAGYGPIEDTRRKLAALLREVFADEIALRKTVIASARALQRVADSPPAVDNPQPTERRHPLRAVTLLFVFGIVILGGASFWIYDNAQLGQQDTSSADNGVQMDSRCVTRIESNPPDAVVSLNGATVGTTPVSVPLNCGVSTELMLQHPGYKTMRQLIRVTKRQTRLRLNLAAFPESDKRQ